MSVSSELLLLTNDLFHPLGHRIIELLPFLETKFRVTKISLVPPGLTRAGRQARHGSFLRGWPSQVIGRREPSIWTFRDSTLIRRTPFPGPLGPLANLLLLKKALSRFRKEISVGILAQGPVPGRAAADLNRPFLYDHVDNYEVGRVSFLHRRLFGNWQRHCLEDAAAVSCAGSALKNHASLFRDNGVTVFPNGVHTKLFSVPKSESTDPSLLYVGGLERDCGLDLTLAGMALMPHPPLLKVAGSGPDRARLARQVEQLGLQNRVAWLGSVPRFDLPALLAEAWIGLAVFKESEWNRFAFHLKLLEYMAGGLPFVTTGVGDAKSLAEETGAGIVIDEDADSIASTISDLINMPSLRREMGIKGKSAARAYDWGVIGPNFVSWVDGFLKDRA